MASTQVGPAARRDRIIAIDVMRGLVMIVMLLDHVRDMVHSEAHHFSPTDLTKTTTVLFFTRWVTHFCASVFVLLAGVGTQRQLAAGMSLPVLSRFLLTRGLWLIFLELTAVRLGAFFSLDPHFIGFFQVIWVIGASMVLMAGLVRLPPTVITVFGLSMIALHNLLDGVGPAAVAPGVATPPGVVLWMLLHRFGPIFTSGGRMAFLIYPIVPWVGVMATGFGLGRVYDWDATRRRRVLTRLGLGALVAFVALRLVGIYGDPSPFVRQPTRLGSFLAFINVSKYPPSLDYLLVTLGPALFALGALEGVSRPGRLLEALATLGRVPLFYYLLQWPYANLAALVLGAATGQSLVHLFRSPPEAFELAKNFGFGLPVVYLVWLVGIPILYLPCRAYAAAKRKYRKWWMSYL